MTSNSSASPPSEANPPYSGSELSQPGQPLSSGWEPVTSQGLFGRQPNYQQQLAPSPAVDIFDNEDDIWVFIDLPGFKQDEIRVRSDQNSLVLSADRPTEMEENRHAVLNERTTHVERTIPLPVSVRTSAAQATFEDGVCKVKLPKAITDQYEDIKFTSEDIEFTSD